MSMYKNGNSKGADSQVTLVDGSSFRAPRAILSFVRDDMKNTRILSSDGRSVYSVETDKATNAHTIVRQGDTGEVVAELKRRVFRPDTIRFRNGEERNLSSWLSGASGKWSDFPVLFEWDGMRYTWKANEWRQIALYSSADPLSPVAWFQTSQTTSVDGMATYLPALLALQTGGLEIIDAVVVSLLVVEYELRIKENRYRNGDGRLTL